MRPSLDGRTVLLRVPGSKSQTQRALLLAAFASGRSELRHPLDCDDSRWLRQALRSLGVQIDDADSSCWRIDGGSLRNAGETLCCGDGGTTLRFLAPLAALLSGPLRIDASAQLRRRPLDPLLAALRQLGVEAEAGGAWPLRLTRRYRPHPRVLVDARASSQFASGLLMIGPLLPGGLELQLQGAEAVVSRPYLELTLEMMTTFGVTVERHDGDRLQLAAGAYRPASMTIEGDWSSAALLLVGAALSGVALELEGVDSRSRQGDRVIVDQLRALKTSGPHRFNLGDCPDLIAPLAVACLLLSDAPSSIENAAHARLKESNRIEILAAGLQRVGGTVEPRSDGLRIEPLGDTPLLPARLDPAGDHRMAMAFGLLSLRQPTITVSDGGCVRKSFPGFWAALERLR